MEQEGRDYRGMAQERVSRFLQFIKDHARRQEKKVIEQGKKEEEYYVSRIKNDAAQRDEQTFRKLGDGVKVAQKIFKSRKINDCRMQEMKVRFDMIQRVQEQAKNKLLQQSQDPQKYRELLKKLISQGLIKLVQEKVEVRCLKSDQKLVSQVISECERQFNETCSVKSKLEINKSNWLADQDLGGVILTSLNGRIVCDNTLRARLSYCLQLLLPVIRESLFKESDQELRKQRAEKKEREKKMKANA